MENIDDFLSKLATGSTDIISSPKTIEDLKKKGVKFDQVAPKTESQFLDELFSERRDSSTSLLNRFPSVPQIAIPTIGFLYDEIRECILFGLFGAAISLSAILVEYSLKQAIVRKNRGNVYDKKEWDRIENIELGLTIVEAKKLNLITADQEELLIRFKDEVRNPYLHYNIKKITKNVIANKVKKVDVNTRKVEELDVPAIDNPLFWGVAKKFVDRETVFNRFEFADKMVKELFQEKK